MTIPGLDEGLQHSPDSSAASAGGGRMHREWWMPSVVFRRFFPWMHGLSEQHPLSD